MPDDDYMTSIRIPRPMFVQIEQFAAAKSEKLGLPVSKADAMRMLLALGIAEATRTRKAS
jgi:hypothetical protein